MNMTLPYGFGKTVNLGYEQAVSKTKEALASEGFGVLSEINVRDTLKKKLDVDFRPYVILGACNPPLAYEALSNELDIGLLLPCNVIIYAANESGSSVVAFLDPEAALELTGNKNIAPLARDVKARLQKVLTKV
jgi:uncharacterized protein (DUF302 family)